MPHLDDLTPSSPDFDQVSLDMVEMTLPIDIGQVDLAQVDQSVDEGSMIIVNDMEVVEPPVDDDGDGHFNQFDNCPQHFNVGQEDTDGDGHGDICDVCPTVSDPLQSDEDLDGIGDQCELSLPGVAVRLTHSGGRLDGQVSLHVVHPYASRLGNEVCTPQQARAGCIIQSDSDTVQTAQFVPEYHGSYLVAVRITESIVSTDTIQVTFQCGSRWLHVPLNRASQGDRQMWDVLNFTWPSCTLVGVDHLVPLVCEVDPLATTRLDGCSCPECQRSTCYPGNCPLDVVCHPESGRCTADCGGENCDPIETCDQSTQACSSSQCSPCRGEDGCPLGYQCRNSYCLRNCYVQEDCGEILNCLLLSGQSYGVCGSIFQCQ